MTNTYNDGAWHGWNGGRCPVHPRSKVDVLFGDGLGSGLLYFAGDLDWGVDPHPVAFRVVKEYKEPREVYEACGLYFPTRELAEGYVGKYTWSPSIDTTIKTYREVLD